MPWLRPFCNPPISTRQLADTLAMGGFEVEDVRPVAPPFTQVAAGGIRLLILLLMATLAISTAAYAVPVTAALPPIRDEQPAQPLNAPYGLWQGVIGKQNVMVLLAPAEQGCESRYYYRKYLFDIPLFESQGMVWGERQGRDDDGITATWTFTALSPDGRTLTGAWASQDGQRHLPIRLDLLALTPATKGDDGKPQYDCNFHDKDFDAPRIARARQEQVIDSADTIFQGADDPHSYRKVSVLRGHIQSLALPDTGNNRRLQRALENWKSASVLEFYDCALSWHGLIGGSGDPYFDSELAPWFWNARMLVLRDSYSLECGKAHPSGGVSGYQVWDLTADRLVDVQKWIKNSDPPGHMPLRDLLDSLYCHEIGEDSCADDTFGDYVSYTIYPVDTGMVFSLSLSYAQGWADFEIPWAQMEPFLTPAGKKGIRTLIGRPVQP